jgi:hypothetical protein
MSDVQLAPATRQWRIEEVWRLLDFWTRTRKSGNPKVVAVFQANFITKHRETTAQTRRDRRQKERLLDRFYRGPPARTPIQKSKKKLAATRQRSAQRHPRRRQQVSQESERSNYQQSETSN